MISAMSSGRDIDGAVARDASSGKLAFSGSSSSVPMGVVWVGRRSHIRHRSGRHEETYRATASKGGAAHRCLRVIRGECCCGLRGSPD
eukprot:scaffold139571_cov130-Phaeocystis_antarctica.AAC.1